MSRRNVGLILLLVTSVVLGVIIGVVFFSLYQRTVPIEVTSFNRAAAQMAFIWYGIVTGVVICAWSMGVIVLSRLFRGGQKAAGASPQ